MQRSIVLDRLLNVAVDQLIRMSARPHRGLALNCRNHATSLLSGSSYLPGILFSSASIACTFGVSAPFTSLVPAHTGVSALLISAPTFPQSPAIGSDRAYAKASSAILALLGGCDGLTTIATATSL